MKRHQFLWLLNTMFVAVSIPSFLIQIVTSYELKTCSSGNEPKVQLEVVHVPRDVQVFNYSDFDPKNELLPPFRSKPFTCEQIVYWETNNEKTESVKLRLTCVAPYITKWTVNSEPDSDPGQEMDEKEKELSLMEYSMQQLPRDNETPFPSDDDREFNLTVFTIHSFGPGFKIGFIDCVSSSDAALSTRLYIFRKSDKYSKLVVTPRPYKSLTDRSKVPCKGVNPDMKLLLVRGCPKKNPVDVTSNFLYDWKSGFRRKDGHEVENGKYCCAFTGLYASYSFVSTAEKPELNQLVPKLRTHPVTKTTYPVCALKNNVKTNANVRVESCISPDYCFPPTQETHTTKFQGKISCVDHTTKYNPASTDYYFTGLSTKRYLLSEQNDLHKDELIQLEKSQERDSQIIISCTVVKFLTSPPIKFSVALSDGTNVLLKSDLENVENDAQNSDSEWKMTQKRIIDMGDENTNAFERVRCHAPLYNSTEWIHSSYIDLTKRSHLIPSAPTFLHLSDSNIGVGQTHTSTFNIETQFELGAKKAVLVCKATGEPSPIISWTYNKQTIRESKGERKPHQMTWSELSFSHVYKTIEGEYVCRATNNLGEVEAKFNVIVVEYFDPTIAIAIGVPVLVVILIAVVSVIVIRKRKPRKSTTPRCVVTEKECFDFLHGNKENNSSDPNSKIFSRAFDKKYIIDQRYLSFNDENVLGSGQYGIVMKGWLTNEHKDATMVAVKTTKKDVDVEYIKALISEIKIMAYIGEHPNLAGFMGASINCIHQGKIFAIVEFCENGDLLRWLRNQKTLLRSSVKIAHDAESVSYKCVNTTGNTNSNLPATTILSQLKWSRDIACGMAFISSKKVIHGDLAARNVLLTKDNVAKISDFGLSRQLLNDYSIYTKTSYVPLPWKWMALESLTSSEYSVKSDVWAFGVTLWEIFSLGASPFPGHNYNEEFIQKLSTGTRPLKPQFASDEIYDIMKSCWNENPQMRPDMSQVCDQFTQLLVTSSVENAGSSQTNYIVLEDFNA